MVPSSALNARPLASPLLPPAALAGFKAAGLALPTYGNMAAPLPVVEPVGKTQAMVSLSQQGLQSRISELGQSTVDAAQQFISNFATQLFGDAAKGATLSFGAVSLETQASYSASFSQASGSASSAAFALSESAHFIGTGQITTTDGQSFDFEIEVNYQASVEASAARASSQPVAIDPPDALALTGKALPEIAFPGSLNELFKLFGRELQVQLNGNEGRSDEAHAGNLTLRLLRLVDHAALLAPRPAPEEPAARSPERNAALASSYSSAPA